MKNNIIYIIALLFIISCNKNSKTEQQNIDTPSLNQMIINYGTYTEGQIYFGCIDAQIDENNFEYKCGFSAILFDSAVINPTVQSLRLGKVTVGTLDLFVTPHLNTNDNKIYYYYMNDVSDNNYISGLFSNKTVPIEVYDTLLNKITSFNFITPQKLHINPRESIITESELPTAKITWNADASNKIGIVAEVSIFRNGTIEKNAVFLADDGVEKIKNIIGTIKGEVSITLYRGSIIIKKGTDNRNYKVTCQARSGIDLDIE